MFLKWVNMRLSWSLIAILFLTLPLRNSFAQQDSLVRNTEDSQPAVNRPPKSDRENARLRGPVKSCIEEMTMPPARDGTPRRSFSTTSEYDPDGRLLSTRYTNPDGPVSLTTGLTIPRVVC